MVVASFAEAWIEIASKELEYIVEQ